MFPFDIDFSEAERYIEKQDIPSDYEVIFETDEDTGEIVGFLTGKIITGIDAIKQWIYIALNITRYSYDQYSWNYGNELLNLIGETYSKELFEAEAERYITECLYIYPFITNIENFEFSIDGSCITCSFTVNTTYGELNMNVNL